MIKKNMCCRQVAIAKMVQFLGARRASLRDTVCPANQMDRFLSTLAPKKLCSEKKSCMQEHSVYSGFKYLYQTNYTVFSGREMSVKSLSTKDPSETCSNKSETESEVDSEDENNFVLREVPVTETQTVCKLCFRPAQVRS